MLIVIIHGLGSNPDKVRYIGKAMTRRIGGRYMCPSYFFLPSAGQNRFALNTQISDVRKQIDDTREGRETLVIVGHSYGGFIATRLRKQYMEEKIFTINTPFVGGDSLKIKHMDDPSMVGTFGTQNKHITHPKGKGVHQACIICYDYIQSRV